MKKQILLLSILGVLFILSFGCLSGNLVETQRNTTDTATTRLEIITPVRGTPTNAPTPTKKSLVSSITEVPTTPVSERTLHFDQNTEPLDFTGEEFTSCIGPKELSGLDISSGQGLATYNRVDHSLHIWGEHGLQQPIYWVKSGSNLTYVDFLGSPDHEWFFYMKLTRANLFDVWLVKPKTDEQIQKHFEGITLAGYPGEYWAGPSYLVFPLQYEKDVFNWMVWNPFTDEEELVSARLPGIGTAVESTHIQPMYDPRSKLAVYACNACGEDDFRAYHLPSQSIVWAVDFGAGTFDDPEWQPIWSEEGETVVFYFGLNKLWVVSRSGDTIIKAILPFGEWGNWVAHSFKWSPDGKRLAMIRDSKDPKSPYLSIISVDEGVLINLCSQIRYGSLGWSYDNRHIFHISDRYAKYTKSTISILDTATGEGWQEVISEDLVFSGWLKP